MNLFGTRYALEILTVCTANICRSPMAECILREELKMRGLGKKVNVSSAGTHVSRPGVMADARARKVCARHGVDLRRCRTRQVTERDFDQFRFILAMDERNYGWLCREFPSGQQNSISLIGTWAQGKVIGDIPDPYFGSPAGFETVYQQLHLSIKGFATQIPDLLGVDN